MDPDRWSGEFRAVSHVMLSEATAAEVGYVGTEHLLLALLQHRDAELADAAAKSKLDPDAVRDLLVERQQAEPRLMPGGVPYSAPLLATLDRATDYANRLGEETAGSTVVAIALADAGEGVAHDVLEELDPGGRWRAALPGAERIAPPAAAEDAPDAHCAIDTVRLSVTGSQRWIALEYDPTDDASAGAFLQLLQPPIAWSERTGFPWMSEVRDDSRSGTGRVVISMLHGEDVPAALEDVRAAIAPINLVGVPPKLRPKAPAPEATGAP